MNGTKFSAHGEVHAQYSVQQRILFIDLVGPFNVEFIQKYEAVVGRVRKNITSPYWGSMVNVHGLALAPMEASNSGQAIIHNAVDAGLVATAIVFHETEGMEMQKKFWSRVYTSTSLPFEYFSSREGAIEWLTEKILLQARSRSATAFNGVNR